MTHGESNVRISNKKKAHIFISRHEVLLPAENGEVQPVTCYAGNEGI
jgi:hypothetical protein